MTARYRLGHLRPLTVGYFWTLAGALVATGTASIHPTLGRVWDVAAIAGALSVAVIPFIHNARARASATGLAAFVILLHAEEWLRLTEATPVGLSIGLIAEVSADQDVRVAGKIDPPESAE